MLEPISSLCRYFVVSCAVTLFLLSVCVSAGVYAQGTENYNAERQRAFQLINDSKFPEALPILEKLAATNSSDGQVMFGLGFARLVASKTIKDVAARKQARINARAALLRAQELGVKNELLEAVLNSLPPDGSGDEVSYSKIKEADEAMHEGEAFYSQGHLDKALAAYERALRLDPRLYEAALFAGDMYFKKGVMDKAGEWFARAIAINENRETAYRYWGDALLAQGKMDEARAKFIEAVIAQPYDRISWSGLIKWAQQNQVQLAHPRIEPPADVSPLKDGKMTINLDPKIFENKDDGSAAWMMYGITRAAWATSKFAKEYPTEKTYRHSLREEAEALRMVATSVKQQETDKKIKTLNPALATLVKLNDEGLLESFVLLAKANASIARDYEAYRQANRDKLRRYLVEYVTSGK